jgi:hypothetical protein
MADVVEDLGKEIVVVEIEEPENRNKYVWMSNCQSASIGSNRLLSFVESETGKPARKSSIGEVEESLALLRLFY